MFLFRLILFPFELLGQILALTGRMLWKLVSSFFFSPWGLIVPLTLLAVLFLSTQLAHTTKQLTESYADELEFCGETKIPALIDNLVRLGDYGISGLVRGLRSPRESVFIACRNTLWNEMERWEQLPPAERVRQYRIFSEALLDRAMEFGPTARNETILFSRKILQRLVALKNNPKDSVQTSNSRLATQNCEQFLSLVKAERTKKPLAEALPEYQQGNTVAQFNRRIAEPTLMTAQGVPFQPDVSDELTPPEYFAKDIVKDIANDSVDSLSVSRAERLYVYHQSPQFKKQLETSYYRPEIQSQPAQPNLSGNVPAEMLASMKPERNTETALPEPDGYQLDNDPSLAEPEGKIAQNYIAKIVGKADSEGSKRTIPPPPETDLSSKTDAFRLEEFRNLPLGKVSALPSVQLMQLLHHPDDRYVSEARKTLIARDGFQDIHLKLAYRLFHPTASVRMEIVSMLPNTSGIRPDVWLSVLLGDLDNEVRYQAASFLATAGDPAMQRLVIDKGKRDSDARIVKLADQLLEQQRRKIRR